MHINRDDLDRAAKAGLIADDKVDPLWDFLTVSHERTTSRFEFTTIAYYFGATVVIIAMAWYLSLAWDPSPGWSISLTALIYAAVFGIAGLYLRASKREPVLGGLLIVVAVCMTPIFIYGIQKQLGLWNTLFPGNPPLDLTGLLQDRNVWNAMVLEAATVTVAALVVRIIRFPFLLVPMLIALWMLVLAPMGFTWVTEARWEPGWVSCVYGLVIIAGGVYLDRPGRNPYGFWFHLIGGFAFVFGLFHEHEGGEVVWLIAAIFSLLIIWFSIPTRRRSHAAFGAVGMMIYFLHLSETLFADSMWYPFILTAFGLIVISLGLWYRQKHEAIDRTLMRFTPGLIRKLLNY